MRGIIKKISAISIAAIMIMSASVIDLSYKGVSICDSSVACAASLNAPSINVNEQSYTNLKVSWNKVSSATKYYVYRSTSKLGTYKKVGETKNLYYQDKSVDQNKTYYYKVKAAGSSSSSKYSSVKAGKIVTTVKLGSVPKYSGKPVVKLNDNKPKFSDKMKKSKKSFETYSKLDSLGRCGITYSCIGKDLMPTEERGSIGMIKPTGWHTVRYDDLVDGKYLYNRCHLQAFMLTGENANERNLVTGTRYMNVEGMLPYETKVCDYIKRTGNHVLYRVTPVVSGKDLVCRGVQMEAYSIEDKGRGVCFNVFAYNVQPGVIINYATGESRRAEATQGGAATSDSEKKTYVLNTNTKKFHLPTCSSVGDMSPSNKETVKKTRKAVIGMG